MLIFVIVIIALATSLSSQVRASFLVVVLNYVDIAAPDLTMDEALALQIKEGARQTRGRLQHVHVLDDLPVVAQVSVQRAQIKVLPVIYIYNCNKNCINIRVPIL